VIGNPAPNAETKKEPVKAEEVQTKTVPDQLLMHEPRRGDGERRGEVDGRLSDECVWWCGEPIDEVLRYQNR